MKNGETSSLRTIKMRTKTVKHSVARLAAVQALYQIELNNMLVSKVIEEFRCYRFGPENIDSIDWAIANHPLFESLVRGVIEKLEEIDNKISPVLVSGWPLERLEIVLRCILRAGTFELIESLQVPAAVVIKEYVDLSYSFFSGSEPGLTNGVLDKIARVTRPGELETRNGKTKHPTKRI